MVIGLTGYYCSGKSTVDTILCNEYGFALIDIDKLGHEALEECSKELQFNFGNEIVTADQKIDRKKLGSIVFSEKEKLSLLNKIVHPVMVSKTLQRIETNKPKHSVISAALLFDMKLNIYCDTIFVVKSPWYKIIYRGIRRDKRTIKHIFAILKSQKLKQFLNENKNNDDIYYINNSGNLTTLQRTIKKLIIKSGVHTCQI